ncbi:MAG TPA: DUF1549 and DUF1553 domain-containing protein [Pirellulaceae bacterium]|nr:DUF1549 and DUF1553 domain-containing protein [Pirellulaceae bacterium]
MSGRRFTLILFAAAALASQTSARGQQEIVAETPKNLTPIDRTPIVEAPITDGDRAHWAFAPVARQSLPQAKIPAWPRTAVDAFILAKLEAEGIAPSAEASRATLLRRLSFDLTGLPPTPQELAAFQADASPDAYERQVDRLLASPAFGERYGQYWLDLARFAETDGYEHDKVRAQAWKYRDWVIAAINADLPYDEFIRQQIAGDEVAGSKFKVQGSKSEPTTLNFEPGTLNSSAASMFCLSGPDMPDINDQLERRHSLMNELTATVGSAFLGLQLGCAQCHDHKYDPLSQADFYRLRAVFEPAVPALKRDVPISALASQKETESARLWVRGDHRRPGLEVQPSFPRIASAPTGRAGEGVHEESDTPSLARRASVRSELADWLVRADNPLTSRVMANRVWQGHFGRGICQTPSDFGVMGGPVTHRELLDWLAAELRESGWGLKGLHRKIVTAATYREISDFRFPISDLEAKGSANLRSEILNLKSELYGRYPRRRLEGEAIRDAMLAAAGLLTSERGGPGVLPPLPEELVGTLLKGQWTASQREADHYKRSVYVFARRNLRYPIFEAFDRPDGNASCPIRNKSTTAPQSLLLFNSEFSLLAARRLAGRVMNIEEPKNQRTEEQIERLYEIALSRQPTAAEITTFSKFLADQQQRLKAEARPVKELALPVPCPDTADADAAAALVDACLAVLNANEFIYVD